MKRLYILDLTTISLFKDILRGVGRNPKEGKKKGGIKTQTIMKTDENVLLSPELSLVVDYFAPLLYSLLIVKFPFKKQH
jgi:hypothetical protein